MKNDNEIIEKILGLMSSEHWTQEELAEKLGYNPASLSLILNGHRMPQRRFLKAAETLINQYMDNKPESMNSSNENEKKLQKIIDELQRLIASQNRFIEMLVTSKK